MTAASADEWIAAKLRGTAEVEVDAVWKPLARGDAVADNQKVRTGPDSRLELTRGAEVIALGPDTEVSVETDLAKSFTIVHQGLGTVEVEAEEKTVQHLEVRNRFLSAVVKGTRFVVTSEAASASVEVTRGLVAVESMATQRTTLVPAGNGARVAASNDLSVFGPAPPSIFDANGLKLVSSTPALPELDPAAATGAAALDISLVQGSPLAAGPGAGASATASSRGGIDLAAAGMGVAVGIAIGALALVARRFFA